MAIFARKYLLLWSLLLLFSALALVGCAPDKGISPSNFASALAGQQSSCTACVTIGKPVLNRISPQGYVEFYQITFLISNNRDSALSQFEIAYAVDTRVDSSGSASISSTSRSFVDSTTNVPANGHFTYNIGNPDDPYSGISLGYPAPTTAHIHLTISQNGNQLASWDGESAIRA